MHAILFINGVPPKELPSVDEFSLVACTDGAFNYLLEKGFPMEKLTFVSGDFDSHSFTSQDYPVPFIHTPNQDKTDFQKALELLMERGAKSVEVYGGSGGEMDHFLGNLSVAHRFIEKLNIVFYDEYSKYFFISKEEKLENVQHKMISLYPFPIAKEVITNGLHWDLNGEELSITNTISTRNFAIKKEVDIRFSDGDLLVFIGKENYKK